ncbi:hypothetical protein AJ85_12165 [Alkalihalobacillus alcalophilus ATCC 27647 = CGMCC 1.3604]|uniref:ATP-grasp domain-containing protein n=1 Tax=Alkalihalobacillus alcalophilus ATCC 27647 = CGMCC 1.3604 TaxID=1218173 RepID=A0A094YRE9_ALKAL|nr:YheC/YheD family protein [Alkalihalobacillus alcalophilus]KGA96062.1 hypothetical protein BALCAV_0218610 [Alkalihalobacillus alcalophilus ATCC 27647 = CGMCC 1.3604]MED1563567.1 YheC/YheD family protein [Alkalihalobacillus alcalophilus]THG92296.1 hypothetical protein AJ85_12165 [Alkalihalobacillus alcalophilus ATCC 27647 = CGMCC 1.3604]
MYINYIPSKKSGIVYITEQIKERYQIHSQRILVQFGNWIKEMVVMMNDELPDETIGFSEDLINEVTIPQELPYELLYEGRHLRIGPVIAYIALKSEKKVTAKRLNYFKKRFTNYDQIKGVIFLCAPTDIDFTTKTIEGYYYNPNGENRQNRWVKATFPYPDSVYKWRKLKEETYDELIKTIGDRIFNSYHFTKWDLYEWGSTDNELKDYFPYTEKLTECEQVKMQIEKYGTVYLKPSNSSRGRGIMMVQQQQEQYQMTNVDNESNAFVHWEDVKKEMQPLLQKDYVIQQSVSTDFDEHHLDFRAYLQKDRNRKWNVQGIIARMAEKGSVTTNLQYTKKIVEAKEALNDIYQVNEEKNQLLYENMESLCIKLCQLLDREVGNYGDLAVDFIVDHEHRLWFLEINKIYKYKSLEQLENDELYKKIMPTPFEYAKTLAGF